MNQFSLVLEELKEKTKNICEIIDDVLEGDVGTLDFHKELRVGIVNKNFKLCKYNDKGNDKLTEKWMLLILNYFENEEIDEQIKLSKLNNIY